jgi:hypothetical protein
LKDAIGSSLFGEDHFSMQGPIGVLKIQNFALPHANGWDDFSRETFLFNEEIQKGFTATVSLH